MTKPLVSADKINLMDLLARTRAVLEDAKFYLSQIDALAYKSPIEILSLSSIGQHTRHFIEFYQLLWKHKSTGSVNYDLRKRDIRLETDPYYASECIVQILEQLQDYKSDQSILLQSVLVRSGVDSTIGRELMYNLEHTIHHLAIIKIGLHQIAPHISLPANFGVAPSTIQHRSEIVGPSS